ncbi:hypothetical protein MJO28_001034, partial [Puccinia striiformis f. sp. tritici]
QGPGQSGPLRATPVAPNPAPRVGEEIDRTWDRPLVGQLNAIDLDMTTCSVVAVTSPPPSPLLYPKTRSAVTATRHQDHAVVRLIDFQLLKNVWISATCGPQRKPFVLATCKSPTNEASFIVRRLVDSRMNEFDSGISWCSSSYNYIPCAVIKDKNTHPLLPSSLNASSPMAHSEKEYILPDSTLRKASNARSLEYNRRASRGSYVVLCPQDMTLFLIGPHMSS